MYCLSSPEIQKESNSLTVKNTQPKLALVRIKSLTIPLPPLDEQRKIGRVLAMVQDAIAQQEQLITLTTVHL
ncbi:MAG: restriction endonuclease subunit S [Nostoc sp. DedSLP03]|uniref:restriction endonuclease subunit S n=1 Tax=Nostoc sp. DedSLP03 TaxID=3075400 RepID=UPI002AD2A267|nr:restriction endonuclease subunit S [Nostoc sp. DedSLP03]MDZ7965040.1 restriction endonuclease subunit S [Nostoc sp. DedSLP03]